MLQSFKLSYYWWTRPSGTVCDDPAWFVRYLCKWARFDHDVWFSCLWCGDVHVNDFFFKMQIWGKSLTNVDDYKLTWNLSWKDCGVGLGRNFFVSNKIRVCIAAVLGAPWGSCARQHIGTQQKYAALYWTFQFRTREKTEIVMWCETRGPRNYYCCLNPKRVITLISLHLINPLWTEVIETCDFAIENICCCQI